MKGLVVLLHRGEHRVTLPALVDAVRPLRPPVAGVGRLVRLHDRPGGRIGLLPRVDGTKRELALEVMFNNSPIASAIRFGKVESIDNSIVTGRAEGMVSLDESINRLLQAGKISRDVADHYVTDNRYLSR